MTLFKKCLRLSQIHDLCISRWKNLIFSEGQPRKIEFLIFLPSSILLEAMKKKLATSSFPRYFYANLPDVNGWWYTEGNVIAVSSQLATTVVVTQCKQGFE